MKFIAEDIDLGVLPLIELLNDNGFRPYSSCDGTIEQHKDKWGNHNPYEVISAYVSMLDSENTRNLFAILMENDSFNLSISNDLTFMLYGNKLSGPRFSIHFDNYRGDNVDVLVSVVKKLIAKKIVPKPKNRKRIDMITRLLSSDIIDENVRYTFEIHSVYKRVYEEQIEENYCIIVSERDSEKDIFELPIRLGIDEADPELDMLFDGYCQIYTKDFNKAFDYLLLAIMNYPKLGTYVEHDEIL